MTNFDDTPPGLDPDPIPSPTGEPPYGEPSSPALAGDPITYAASVPGVPHNANFALPEDLRISWSWPHLILFLFFSGVSFVLIKTALVFYYRPPPATPQGRAGALSVKKAAVHLWNESSVVCGSLFLSVHH